MVGVVGSSPIAPTNNLLIWQRKKALHTWGLFSLGKLCENDSVKGTINRPHGRSTARLGLTRHTARSSSIQYGRQAIGCSHRCIRLRDKGLCGTSGFLDRASRRLSGELVKAPGAMRRGTFRSVLPKNESRVKPLLRYLQPYDLRVRLIRPESGSGTGQIGRQVPTSAVQRQPCR
jgi:hypothetical protein